MTATANGVTISTGNPVTFTATGVAVFAPLASTSLSGTQTFASVNIPVGVTVTMSGDVTLNVTGPVIIAGTLIGDCRNLTISTTGSFTSSGQLQ